MRSMSLSKQLCTGTDARPAGPLYRRRAEIPYVEGLRLDEAMHPLTLMTVVFMARRYRHKMARRCD